MSDSQRYRLVPYISQTGKIPVQDFLEELAASDPEAAAKFENVVRPLVEEFGPHLGMPHFKQLPPTDFSEIRWDGKNNVHYRIYCTVEKNGKLLLLHAVPKRWLKFDRGDKQICKKRYADYSGKEYDVQARYAFRK